MATGYAATTELTALQRLTALTPLDGHDRELLRAAASAPYVLPARREILSEGRPIGRASILLDGWAYRARTLRDGRRQILHFLLPGDLIGVCHHRNPNALTTIIALTNVTLCAAPPPPGQQGEGLAEMYALSRHREEEYLLHQIIRLGRLSAYERIVDWLLETGDRLALAGLCANGRFALPVTQETMADMLGLTSVHVNRMLQSMWRDGLLRIQGGVATILDRDRCVQMADYSRTTPSPGITAAFSA
jgi:CRP-like cAMP-binding protein